MRFPVYLRMPTKYHRLPLSDNNEKSNTGNNAEGPGEQPNWLRPCNVIVAVVIAVLAASLIIISTLYVQLLHHHQDAPRPLLTCGKTIEEAKQAGCSFDRLTKTWLPAACPRRYEEQFVQYPSRKLNMTEWTYWTDLNTTEEITDDDMALFAETKHRGDVSWVSTLRMHIVHCAFGLKRRADLTDAGERIDLATAPLDHTHHCIEMLLDAAMRAPGIDVPLAQGKVIFGAC